MQAIKTIGLTKRYKSTVAVDSLDIEIGKGELFSLLGLNGAGKTTTIKMLTCLTRPTSGEGYVGGYSVTENAECVKRLIGVAPQESAIAPKLSVFENLYMMSKIYGFSKEKSAKKLDELSDIFGLSEVLKKKAGKLSGGYKRRLSLAMALIGEPEILFLDEPTLGLDVLARRELWDVILSLKGKITIVLTTHYMEEAEALSDRIGIMKSAHLLSVGTPRELMEKANADCLEAAFVSIVKEGAI